MEGAYPLSAYYASKVLAELPFEQIYPIVFVCISYWIVGLRSSFLRFFVFVCIVSSSNFAASGLGMTISALVREIRTAAVMLNILMLSLCDASFSALLSFQIS